MKIWGKLREGEPHFGNAWVGDPPPLSMVIPRCHPSKQKVYTRQLFEYNDIYILYHIISYHIIFHHIISYFIILYHIISYYIISYHIISFYIILYLFISYYIILYHFISYHIILYHIISYYIISYYIMLHHISSYYIILYVKNDKYMYHVLNPSPLSIPKPWHNLYHWLSWLGAGAPAKTLGRSEGGTESQRLGVFDMDSYRDFLMIFDTVGYCWILLDTVGYCWILLDTVGYCWILLDTVGYCWILLDTVGYCWILLDTVGYCWILLDTVGYCWILLLQIHHGFSFVSEFSGHERTKISATTATLDDLLMIPKAYLSDLLSEIREFEDRLWETQRILVKPMVSQWFPNGFPMVLQWFPNRNRWLDHAWS